MCDTHRVLLCIFAIVKCVSAVHPTKLILNAAVPVDQLSVMLLELTEDPPDDETPLQAAERQAQESYDAVSLAKSKAEEMMAIAKAANQTLADKATQEAEAQAEAMTARHDLEVSSKEGQVKTAEEIVAKKEAAERTAKTPHKNPTDATMDALNDQLAAETENSMGQIDDAQRDVAAKTTLLNDFISNYAEQNATDDDERREKVADSDLAARAKEVDEKEFEKERTAEMQEEQKQKRLRGEALAEKDVKVQAVQNEAVTKHQNRISDVLDAEQSKILDMNNTLMQQKFFNVAEMRKLVLSSMKVKAQTREATKAMSALQSKVEAVNRARGLEAKLEREKSELGVKRDHVTQMIANHTREEEEMNVERSEIEEKKATAATLLDKEKVKAAAVERKSKRDKHEVELLMQVQQKQFDDFVVYRSNEEQVKQLQRRKQVAQQKLDELVSKHKVKQEELAKQHVISAARKFDLFMEREKQARHHEVREKAKAEEEEEGTRELNEKTSTHLFDTLKHEDKFQRGLPEDDPLHWYLTHTEDYDTNSTDDTNNTNSTLDSDDDSIIVDINGTTSSEDVTRADDTTEEAENATSTTQNTTDHKAALEELRNEMMRKEAEHRHEVANLRKQLDEIASEMYAPSKVKSKAASNTTANDTQIVIETDSTNEEAGKLSADPGPPQSIQDVGESGYPYASHVDATEAGGIHPFV